jgi:hypothetical protein
MRTSQRKITHEFLNKTKLYPSLQHLIIDLLYEDKITSTNNIQTACKHQDQIGWDHFLRGRISKKWTEQQNNLTDRQDGNKVWGEVMVHIFYTLHKIWEDRNNQLHSNDLTSLQVQRRMETIIKPKLRTLYNLQHLIPVRDQVLFEKTLDEMMLQQPQYLEKWISRNEKYIHDSAKRESHRIKLNNTAITSFFSRLPPT